MNLENFELLTLVSEAELLVLFSIFSLELDKQCLFVRQKLPLCKLFSDSDRV